MTRFSAGRIRCGALAVVLSAPVACGGSPSAPTPAATATLAGFVVAGDPVSGGGATWTYRGTRAGVTYDLQGVLLKPAGPGPFPAVIISHGAGGNAGGYSRTLAQVMVSWGLVAIATNYTHADGVPIGLPGTSSDPGASAPNVLRARQVFEILKALGYVDLGRLALHGHSMGAFVTAATAGAYPDLFRAASHTAGGIAPELIAGLAPSEAQIAGLRVPYQMHHGDRDFVVPLLADELFAAAIRARGVVHELVVYAGAGHDDVRLNPVVLDRIREWYRGKGVL